MANRTKIEKLEDLIRDTIGGEVVEQTVGPLLPPGGSFGSVVYKVDFKVKKDGKEEEYHAVAKCTPPNPVTQELFNTQETFKAEIGWHTTVIPTLKQFQKDHGVEKEIDFFQAFYGARISLDPKSDKVDLDGVLLTQNIKYLGYHSIDKLDCFDFPTTHAILRDLATFHAVPLAIRLQNAELFNKNIKPYLARFGDPEGLLKKGVDNTIIAVFGAIPEFESIMDRIKKSVKEALAFTERPIREPWATVIHMDVWLNNILVTGGKDPKTMFLDLQFPCIGSPAADLVFLLITSVNLEVIRDKFDDFVKYYYDQFIKNLKELNVSTENYTLEGLFEEITIEGKIGEFGHCLGHSFGITSDKGKTPFDTSDANFKREKLLDQDFLPFAPTERQIQKFKWIGSEAFKRKWI